jgi:hypothetical protein
MDQYEEEGLDQEFTEQMTYEERVRPGSSPACGARFFAPPPLP